MKYKNRKTGELFIHLARAVRLNGMSPVDTIVFCPSDKSSAIFTMDISDFKIAFDDACIECGSTKSVSNALCGYCQTELKGLRLISAA